MSDKTATPKLIRETALEILKHMPTGVRQTDLFSMTEETLLSRGLVFDKDHSIRNALWNLQDKYPSLVEKRNVGKRTALIFFKEENINNQVAEEKSIYEVSGELNSLLPLKLRMQAFLLDFDSLVKENIKLFDGIFELDPDDYQYLTLQEIDAIHNIRLGYQLLSEARDIYLTKSK